jgi:hypothetical protein
LEETLAEIGNFSDALGIMTVNEKALQRRMWIPRSAQPDPHHIQTAETEDEALQYAKRHYPEAFTEGTEHRVVEITHSSTVKNNPSMTSGHYVWELPRHAQRLKEYVP